MITVYSTHCPQCVGLERKLTQQGIEFKEVTDIDEIMKISEEHNLRSVPILQVEDKFLVGKAIYDYLDSAQQESCNECSL